MKMGSFSQKPPASIEIINQYLASSLAGAIAKMQEIEEKYDLPIDIHFDAIMKNLALAPFPIAQLYVFSPPPSFTPLMKQQLLEKNYSLYNQDHASTKKKNNRFGCTLL